MKDCTTVIKMFNVNILYYKNKMLVGLYFLAHAE